MKNVEQDAYWLIFNIYQSVLRQDKYTIVNIAKSDLKVFNYKSISVIPWSYGYTYDNILRLLTESDIVIASNKNRWYVGKELNTKYSSISEDQITLKAIEIGYFKKNEHASYYSNFFNSSVSYGPQPGGLYSCLIDIDKLLLLYNSYNFSLPKFDNKKGILNYQSSALHFEGEYQIKAVDLLISNLNKRVSESDFYNIVRDIQTFKDSSAQKEASKKLFKEIKTKIKKDKFLSEVFVCVHENGFGIFLDNKLNFGSPQKS